MPVVRATGGLDDTIEPWDAKAGKGTGFKFSDYTGDALLATVRAALAAFKDKEGWKKLMLNDMNKDFSWAASAKEYIKIYERVKQSRSAAA